MLSLYENAIIAGILYSRLSVELYMRSFWTGKVTHYAAIIRLSDNQDPLESSILLKLNHQPQMLFICFIYIIFNYEPQHD
jgi:hypothetical protein